MALSYDQYQQLIVGLFFMAVAGGVCGAIMFSASLCIASRVIFLIFNFFDRRDRIRNARSRAAQEAAI